MKKRILSVCLVLLCSLFSYAQSRSVAGEWHGYWTNSTGVVFSAEMTLQTGSSCADCAVKGDGSVRGEIIWTLKKVGSNASEAYAKKVGMAGTEFVKGEMKGDGLLVLDGYDKDDPNTIIGIWLRRVEQNRR